MTDRQRLAYSDASKLANIAQKIESARDALSEFVVQRHDNEDTIISADGLEVLAYMAHDLNAVSESIAELSNRIGNRIGNTK